MKIKELLLLFFVGNMAIWSVYLMTGSFGWAVVFGVLLAGIRLRWQLWDLIPKR